MAKKATTNSSAASDSASAIAAGSAAAKATAPRGRRHLKSQAAGVAAAVEEFVNTVMNAGESKPAVEVANEQISSAVTTAPFVVTHADVAKLAYEFYLERGGYGGSPADDWFRAEAALKAGGAK